MDIDSLNLESYGSDIATAITGKFKEVCDELKLLGEVVSAVRDNFPTDLGPMGMHRLNFLRNIIRHICDDQVLSEVTNGTKEDMGRFNSKSTGDIVNELKEIMKQEQ